MFLIEKTRNKQIATNEKAYKPLFCNQNKAQSLRPYLVIKILSSKICDYKIKGDSKILNLLFALFYFSKNERRKMLNEKDNKNKKYSCFWRFCKISYHQKNEEQNKKIIIIPRTTIALQVGDSFYLQNLKKLKRTKTNTKHIKILERYDYIPTGTSEKLKNYYLDHQRKRQEKLNTENQNH